MQSAFVSSAVQQLTHTTHHMHVEGAKTTFLVSRVSWPILQLLNKRLKKNWVLNFPNSGLKHLKLKS